MNQIILQELYCIAEEKYNRKGINSIEKSNWRRICNEIRIELKKTNLSYEDVCDTALCFCKLLNGLDYYGRKMVIPRKFKKINIKRKPLPPSVHNALALGEKNKAVVDYFKFLGVQQ